MVCYRLVSIPIFSNFQLGMKYGSQVFEWIYGECMSILSVLAYWQQVISEILD
jgi:hypothetical protein